MASFIDKNGNIIIKNEKFKFYAPDSPGIEIDCNQIFAEGNDVSFCFDFDQIDSENRVIISVVGTSDNSNSDDDSAKIRFGMLKEQFIKLRELLNTVTI